MEPTPETIRAAAELAFDEDSARLITDMRELTDRAQALVPDLIGVSITHFHHGVTFTFVAPDTEVAVLDAIQPTDDAAPPPTSDPDDALDERRWQLLGLASAARSVLSSLTLPILAGGDVVGSVNLYGGSRRAFADRHDDLAEIFGAWAAGAVANADLSFTTRQEAEQGPARAREHIHDVAVGILAAEREVSVEEADALLREAADRAGAPVAEVARAVIKARRRRLPGEEGRDGDEGGD